MTDKPQLPKIPLHLFGGVWYDGKFHSVAAGLRKEAIENLQRKIAMCLGVEFTWLKEHMPIHYNGHLELMYRHAAAGRLVVREGVLYGPSPIETPMMSWEQADEVSQELRRVAESGKLETPTQSETSQNE